MNKKLKEKINEAFSAVLPITIIVLILSIFFASVTVGTDMMFLAGAVLLITGMGLFSLGADMAMIPMGEGIGAQLTKTKKILLVIAMIFGMGVLITIAEPDLIVLAKLVTSVPQHVLIGAVAIGVGLFLVAAILRIFFQVSLSRMLLVLYFAAFVIAFFAPDSFVAVAFDSGGVTTGPITVPFILALGIGVASVRGDKSSRDDSFGLVALCSIGPILAVLLLGIWFNVSDADPTPFELSQVDTMQDVVRLFAQELPAYFKEVILALVPIALFFIMFQLFTRRYKPIQLARIGVGFIYTLAGLVLFLTGVNVGFIPMGVSIGSNIAASEYKWLLVPLGMLIGYYIVAAEPAVHVLNKQVEQISGGAIPASVIQLCLSIGVSVSLGLSVVRVLTGIHIFWFLIPGYVFALLLTFFVPKIFTGIAFDSGGVATGPMTSTFLLPFTIGICSAVGGNVMTDAFGLVAMVAMAPLITIQALGLAYKRKMKALPEEEGSDIDELVDYDNVDVLTVHEEGH